MKPFKFLIFLFFLTIQSSVTLNTKVNGVSFVASRVSINDAQIKPVININANYAAIMPFWFIK